MSKVVRKPTDVERMPQRCRTVDYCVALDSDGKLCRKLAQVVTYYFGDPETRKELSWVVVTLCGEHYVAYENPPDAKWFKGPQPIPAKKPRSPESGG